jgi:hypothetical protein
LLQAIILFDDELGPNAYSIISSNIPEIALLKAIAHVFGAA